MSLGGGHTSARSVHVVAESVDVAEIFGVRVGCDKSRGLRTQPREIHLRTSIKTCPPRGDVGT